MIIKIYCYKHDHTVTTLNDYLQVMTDLHGVNNPDYYTAIFERALHGPTYAYHNFYGRIHVEVTLDQQL